MLTGQANYYLTNCCLVEGVEHFLLNNLIPAEDLGPSDASKIPRDRATCFGAAAVAGSRRGLDLLKCATPCHLAATSHETKM